MADNSKVVNYLFVRILRQKTRWSDSFSAILDFTENQAIFTTFTHICQHKLIPPTGRYNLFRGAFPLYMISGKTEYDLDKETGCDFRQKPG